MTDHASFALRQGRKGAEQIVGGTKSWLLMACTLAAPFVPALVSMQTIRVLITTFMHNARAICADLILYGTYCCVGYTLTWKISLN